MAMWARWLKAIQPYINHNVARWTFVIVAISLIGGTRLLSFYKKRFRKKEFVFRDAQRIASESDFEKQDWLWIQEKFKRAYAQGGYKNHEAKVISLSREAAINQFSSDLESKGFRIGWARSDPANLARKAQKEMVVFEYEDCKVVWNELILVIGKSTN